MNVKTELGRLSMMKEILDQKIRSVNDQIDKLEDLKIEYQKTKAKAVEALKTYGGRS